MASPSGAAATAAQTSVRAADVAITLPTKEPRPPPRPAGGASASSTLKRTPSSFAIEKEKLSERFVRVATRVLEGPVHIDVEETRGHITTVSSRRRWQATKRSHAAPPTEAHLPDDEAASRPARHTPRWLVVARIVFILAALYGFMVGLVVMGDAFQVVGGKAAGSMFKAIDNPLAGLVVGILATVLVQSSSTSSSIVVGLVGSGIMTVPMAIPVICGLNIGTSVTNTLVSMGHMNDPREYERAFAGATVHDAFNLLSVVTLLPIEIIVRALTPGEEGGVLYAISVALTADLEGSDGSTFKSPIKAIVKPLASLLLEVDKAKIEALSVGRPTVDHCLSETGGSSPLVVSGVNYHICGNTTLAEASAATYEDVVVSGSLIKGGAWLDSGASDSVAGTVTLLVGLSLIVGALFAMVHLLHVIVAGSASKALKKAAGMNGYAAILVGAALTAVVQSSSIVTSTLTPLVGVGMLSLESVYPLTLGANLGTSLTGFLAALAAGTRPAVQVAVCQTAFNVMGVLLWYPIPAMRALPLRFARWLGRWAVEFKWLPPIYVGVVFVLAPLTLLGMSLLYSAGGFLLGLGIGITVLLVLVGASFYAWLSCLGGRARMARFMHRPVVIRARYGDDGEDGGAAVTSAASAASGKSVHGGDTERELASESSMFVPVHTSHVVGREVDTVMGKAWIMGIKGDAYTNTLRLVVQYPWGVGYLTGSGIYGAANEPRPLASAARVETRRHTMLDPFESAKSLCRTTTAPSAPAVP